MKYFSIRELEHFSNIKSHTIRIWEVRFKLFNPGRSSGNTRYYSIHDVEKLFLVEFLIRKGKRISELSKLNHEQLISSVNNLLSENEIPGLAVNKLIITMYEGNEEQFESILDNALLQFGTQITIANIIIAFLEKTNLISYIDSSPEVHFAVTILRRKIILGIESAPNLNEGKTALLFLPKGEHFDLILLYLSFLLKNYGIKVYYLGTNVPDKTVQSVALSKEPDFIIAYVYNMKKNDFYPINTFVTQNLPQSKFIIATIGDVNALPKSTLHTVYFRDVLKEISS